MHRKDIMHRKKIVSGKIKFNSVELPIVIYPEGNMYVSEVPMFNIASQGRSIEEALKNIKEAIELYFEDEDVEKLIEERLPAPNVLTTTMTFDTKSKQVIENLPTT